MNIYFNGDSNTNGAELEPGQGFADIIIKHYNASFVNHALNGGSCDHIIRTTREYINECKRTNSWPDLVIIGWTECFRTEWFADSNYRTVVSLEAYDEISDQERYEYVKTRLWGNTNYTRAMLLYMNELIYNLHCELTDLKIPHLFFNAINALNMEDKVPHWQYVRKYNFGNNFFHPYTESMTMREWALTKNYQQITPDCFHFEPAAQQAWADILIQHIEQNQILTTST